MLEMPAEKERLMIMIRLEINDRELVRSLWEELGQHGKILDVMCNNLTVCENQTGPNKNKFEPVWFVILLPCSGNVIRFTIKHGDL